MDAQVNNSRRAIRSAARSLQAEFRAHLSKEASEGFKKRLDKLVEEALPWVVHVDLNPTVRTKK